MAKRDVRITFGMIVLNGQPFVRYNLQAIYPFAHQIIVVEGACPTAKSMATQDGHSTDGTLDVVREFQALQDPDHKLVIVTAEDEGHRNGFWTEKDEMSQAYASRATGNYLWQIDCDEFYKTEDMEAVLEILGRNEQVTDVTFTTITFWGGLNYVADGLYLRRGYRDFHRLFAWGPGYSYVTHRPPTVVDDQGRDTRNISPITAAQMRGLGIYMYHYAYLFPSQAEAKLAYYGPMSPQYLVERQRWFDNYARISRPFYIDPTSLYGEPSWLARFHKKHPEAVVRMWQAVTRGDAGTGIRWTDDIEHLLSNPLYVVGRAIVPLAFVPVRYAKLLADSAKGGRLYGALKACLRPVKRAINAIALVPDRVASASRLLCLDMPILSRWARKRWMVECAAQADPADVENARKEQFSSWHPEDLDAKIDHYSKSGCLSLIVDPSLEAGALTRTLESLEQGECLIVYAPHPFALDAAQRRGWLPSWREICALAEALNCRVVDFNPGFDRNGYYHVVIERPLKKRDADEAKSAPAQISSAHFFYLGCGKSRTLGHSSKVQSAAGYRVLDQMAGRCAEHSFSADLPQDVSIAPGTLTMGHYGRWILPAARSGALVVLYGPGIRFRETYESGRLGDAHTRGTLREQYASCHMAIVHAGGLWRTLDPWKYPGLCRWMDIPVSAAVFPRTKHAFNPPGKRVFCFVNLYNEEQKGSDTARRICEQCPEVSFMTIGCGDFRLPNCRSFPNKDNRSAAYRSLIVQADFLVSPSRDDCQPGTPAECASLGLIPIVSEYSGYVLSFPRRIDVDDPDQCARTIEEANNAEDEKLRAWQALMSQYLELFHRPERCEKLLRFYLDEARAEYAKNPPARRAIGGKK